MHRLLYVCQLYFSNTFTERKNRAYENARKMKIYFHTEAYTQMFRVAFSHNSWKLETP